MFSRKLIGIVRSSVGRQIMRSRCTAALNDQIGIIGIPFADGQRKAGVDKGATFLRKAGLNSNLESMGYKVTDFGNLEFEKHEEDIHSFNVRNPRTVGAASKKISDTVYHVVSSGHTCVSVGGDHSVSIGTVHGNARANPDLTLVWVDAHPDLNTPLASTSGNIHGMVLAFLLHELRGYIPPIAGMHWLRPCLRAKDIVYIGLRDIDLPERYIIERLGIACYTMHDIDRHGLDYVLENAMDRINPGLTRPIHLSYDIDALDPNVSPSTGTPVPGGLTMREGMFIAEELALTDKLTGMDLVEVNPELGSQRESEQTVNAAVDLISACFGKRRRGSYIPADYELPRPAAAEWTAGGL